MILTRNRKAWCRGGFTLVELMVAAALSITIMWILAESFKMGIDFARSAHSTGDMMTQLNNAGQILTRDLQAPHFMPTITNPNGKLSLCTLDQMGSSGAPGAELGYTPPSGYFQIVSPPPSASIIDDAGEGFLITTTAGATATVPGASLAFTAFLPQGLPQNLFSTTSPLTGASAFYYSRAAEVAFFLGPQTGTTSPVAATGVQLASIQNPLPQPLYSLYRRQRLVAVTSDYVPNLSTAVASDPNAADTISYTTLPTTPPTNQVNTLANFGAAYVVPGSTALLPPTFVPASRLPLIPLSTTSGRYGDDILLSNVLSFEVLAIWTPSPFIPQSISPTPTPFLSPRPFTVTNNAGNASYPISIYPLNSNYPFDNFSTLGSLNPAYPYTFDTWYSLTNPFKPASNWNNISTTPNNVNLLPLPIRVSSIQVTIRIYDPKTKQARQNTWRIAM